MNTKKIIFLVIVGIIVLSMVLLLTTLNSKNTQKKTKTTNKKFSIWIVGDDKTKFIDFVSDFKNANKEFANTNIDVESFPNYDDYMSSLSLSYISGNTPDIFVINNNETGVFSGQTLPIPAELIKTSDFRKLYKGVFSDDLIKKDGVGEKVSETLIGIPVGYETLGVFYKGGSIKSTDLDSWAGFNTFSSVFKHDNPDIIPIGIGNGSTVYDFPDIITSFLVGYGSYSIDKLNNEKEGLLSYVLYGDDKGYNSYNSKFEELKSNKQNNLDLFSKGDVISVMGYPRMLEQIDIKGFSNANRLLATKMPYFGTKNEKVFVNYNYFVVNKDTSNLNLAFTFLQYLTKDEGSKKYLKKYPYYLPALLSLEASRLDENILSGYNIKLRDFFIDDKRELASFNKGIKTIYDKEIVTVFDDSNNYSSLFDAFKKALLCKTRKMTTFENLSDDCSR